MEPALKTVDPDDDQDDGQKTDAVALPFVAYNL